MDVSHQRQEIGILLADDRFVTILKEVAVPPVAAVERNGIAGHQRPHQPAQRNIPTPEQEMEMVRKQRPGVAPDPSNRQDRLETGEETLVILTVPEDPGPVNSPGYDVLEETGGIESGMAGHRFYLVIAETAMDETLFKASDDGRIDILREWKDITK